MVLIVTVHTAIKTGNPSFFKERRQIKVGTTAGYERQQRYYLSWRILTLA